MNRLPFLLPVLFLLSSSLVAQPYPRRWASLGGPAGGTINSFAANARGDLYAATKAGGVFRLTAGARLPIWEPVGRGLFAADGGREIAALIVAPDGDLYAVADRSSVYRLPAGVPVWEAVTRAGLPPVADLLAVAETATTLIVGARGAGAFRLGAGGWEPWSSGLPSGSTTTVTALEVAGSGAVVAATEAGVYLLPPGGVTWSPAAAGLTSRVTAIAVDPSTATIWAGTRESGVFYLAPSGAMWTAAPPMTDPRVLSLLLDPYGNLFAGLEEGFDLLRNGSTAWEGPDVLRPETLGAHRQVRALGRAGNGVYAGTTRGCFFYGGSGTWLSRFEGMSALEATAVAPSGTADALVGTDGGGVFRRVAFEGSGPAWKELSGSDPAYAVHGRVVSVFEADSGELWAAHTRTPGRFVSRAAAGSHQWLAADEGISAGAGAEARALVFNPSDRFLYLALSGGGGVYRRDDGIWVSVAAGLDDTNLVSLHVAGDGVLYAGTLTGGVFRLDPGSSSWSSLNSGLPLPAAINTLVRNNRTGDLWASVDGAPWRYDAVFGWTSDSAGLYSPSCPAAKGRHLAASPAGVTLLATDCTVARRGAGSSIWSSITANLFRPLDETAPATAAVNALAATAGGILAAGSGFPAAYLGNSRLAWLNTESPVVHLWLMEGTAVVAGAVFKTSKETGGVRWTDFDGDGFDELFLGYPDRRTIEIGEKGQQLSVSPFLYPVGPEWEVQAVADFNGDGSTDLIWRNLSTHEAHLWLMGRNLDLVGVRLAAATLPPAGANWKIAGAWDFDGDGHADILWRNSTLGETHVWFMDGTTVVSGARLPPASAEWSIAAVADFDGDGKGDLIWRHESGEAHMWLMSGGTIRSGAVLPPASTLWQLAGVGDFDGDGRSDLLWRHLAIRQTHMWLMSGSTIVSGAVLPFAGGEWVVVQ